ncbi:MAG: SelT/SelW/SelH family protein [Nevskiales bacterium]
MTKPRVEIEYCTQCHWLMRAAWMAQELLTTFTDELGAVSLVPGTGGIYQIRLDGEILLDRKLLGHFPDIREIKQILRDRIAPNRDLGHTDRINSP